MSEAQKDTQRALAAAMVVFDDRDPATDYGDILVTTEHVIATVLLALFRDPRKAAAMLNEGLVQGVENRLAFYASKQPPQ